MVVGVGSISGSYMSPASVALHSSGKWRNLHYEIAALSLHPLPSRATLATAVLDGCIEAIGVQLVLFGERLVSSLGATL